jgi:hypothetical protein
MPSSSAIIRNVEDDGNDDSSGDSNNPHDRMMYVLFNFIECSTKREAFVPLSNTEKRSSINNAIYSNWR